MGVVRSPGVQKLLREYDSNTLARYVCAGFLHGALALLSMGESWNRAGGTLLSIEPLLPVFPEQKAVYSTFAKTSQQSPGFSDYRPRHNRVYGRGHNQHSLPTFHGTLLLVRRSGG